MQIGVVFPQTEMGPDSGGVRAYAQAVQDMGYAHVAAADHVLGADPAGHPGWDRPYTHESNIHEPFALFAFMAGVAPRLGLMPGVIILPQRQATLVAKQAAAVDVLSGGQFRLGVGIGWNPVEFEGLGMDFKNRARRFEEQIELMRQLWKQPVVTFKGDFHTVTAAGINPLPVQRPIPIWIGASAEPAVKRATRIADGFLPLRTLDGGGWPATIEKVHGWLREAGRDPKTFGLEGRLDASVVDHEAWRKTVDEWVGYGASHLQVSTAGGGLRGADQHIERLRAVREVLADRLAGRR
ncbi:MAG: LLM class F420-dependent oxidoreductase [Chloroflexota bacterium]